MAKPTHTPMLQTLQQAFRLALTANKRKTNDVNAVVDEAAEHRDGWSRRKFLERTAALGALAGVASFANACSPDPNDKLEALKKKNAAIGDRCTNVSVAIVGAGIAGLHAAHILKKSGITATIYEASTRTGGRMYTASNILAPGLTTELGGEFIDSSHTDMFNLATEFGFSLYDTASPSETALHKYTYYFGGQSRSIAQVVTAFQGIATQMQADIDSLPANITYDDFGNAATLDNTSIHQYLVNIGCNGWLRSLLETAFETEYGLSCTVQSSLNMLRLISTDTSAGILEPFGSSDERYKIVGGNQKIPTALANLYASQIQFGKSLVEIKKMSGKYRLAFDNCSTTVMADYVIMAIPFSILRNVDIDVSLPSWKLNAINNLGYGTNAKLMMGFNNRQWRIQGATGYTFTDNGMQNGWDSSQLQPGANGGFTVFTGGSTGVALGNGTAAQQAAIFLPKLNQIYPGISSHYNGNVQRYHWPTSPFVLGSYACYKVGQWTTIAGAEQKTVGNLYFAGEHTSLDFQGYMDGGALTGREAAEAIIKKLTGL